MDQMDCRPEDVCAGANPWKIRETVGHQAISRGARALQANHLVASMNKVLTPNQLRVLPRPRSSPGDRLTSSGQEQCPSPAAARILWWSP